MYSTCFIRTDLAYLNLFILCQGQQKQSQAETWGSLDDYNHFSDSSHCCSLNIPSNIYFEKLLLKMWEKDKEREPVVAVLSFSRIISWSPLDNLHSSLSKGKQTNCGQSDVASIEGRQYQLVVTMSDLLESFTFQVYLFLPSITSFLWEEFK